MKRIRLSRSSFRTAHGASRSGAGVTLVEVLISLLMMSVAVSSVMILFPLSLLRSVQGRKLTQATILRYNAENLIDIQPNMLSHMKSDGNFLDIPPTETLFFVDPLGWHLMWDVSNQNANYRDWIGGRRFGLRRFNSGLRNQNFPDDINRNLPFRNQARKLVSLPDTWINIARGVPSYDPSVPSLTMPSDVDLSDIPTNAQQVPTPLNIARVTVFDATARFSEVRTITRISGNTIELSSQLSPSVLASLGEARIAVQDQRYSWLLTVRSSVRSADVVVFFNRTFSTEDERIYLDQNDFLTWFNPSSPGPDGKPGWAGIDDNNNGETDEAAELGWPNTDDHPNRRILIKWSGGSDNKPFIRRNGFVFDVQNALWYRIHKIENETNSSVVLVLDEVIKAKGTGGTMLMRGIVDVYPISYQPPFD